METENMSTLNIDINLAEPFEKVLATVLSLPTGKSNPPSHRLNNKMELKKAIRTLYEAANGRQVETTFGFVAIAPPVAAFLKERPFRVASQIDFLVTVATRLLSGSVRSDAQISIGERFDKTFIANRSGSRPSRQAGRPWDGHISSSAQTNKKIALVAK